MQREIKFRGIKKSGLWVYGYFWKAPDNTHYIKTFDTGEDVKVTPETVGQSTGLNDKNGVEIYEGHIVKYYHRMGEKYHQIFEIKWSKKNAGYDIDREDATISEVLGNIYEHPELLDN
jgi:uncharacterized phage protein (TIGR01671 family)